MNKKKQTHVRPSEPILYVSAFRNGLEAALRERSLEKKEETVARLKALSESSARQTDPGVFDPKKNADDCLAADRYKEDKEALANVNHDLALAEATRHQMNTALAGFGEKPRPPAPAVVEVCIGAIGVGMSVALALHDAFIAPFIPDTSTALAVSLVLGIGLGLVVSTFLMGRSETPPRKGARRSTAIGVFAFSVGLLLLRIGPESSRASLKIGLALAFVEFAVLVFLEGRATDRSEQFQQYATRWADYAAAYEAVRTAEGRVEDLVNKQDDLRGRIGDHEAYVAEREQAHRATPLLAAALTAARLAGYDFGIGALRGHVRGAPLPTLTDQEVARILGLTLTDRPSKEDTSVEPDGEVA